MSQIKGNSGQYRRLSGGLYYSAWAVAAFGLFLFNRKVFHPKDWSVNFGAPIGKLITGSNDPAYVYMKSSGGRDLGMGVALLAFALLRDRRAFGITMIAVALIGANDAVAVYNHSPDSVATALQIHGGVAVASACIAYLALFWK
jgi:hypothetical protein